MIKERKTGLIFESKAGEVAYGFNCVGIFRGCATEMGSWKLAFGTNSIDINTYCLGL